MEFELIYKEYWGKIFRLCMGYVNDYELARDMAQETFIKVWQHLPEFRNEAAVGTWIFRIATNHCLRQLEQRRQMPPAEFPANLPEEERMDKEPQIQLLYRSIAELPEIDRIIISLELEEVRQAEIAQIVGLSESNVRVRIHRIKEVLTRKMRGNGE
jgi:RNA polymerase sigma-70 factor (ECF subfamily)